MTFYQRLQGSFTCHWGDPITRDRHYSDHPSHYVSRQPRIEPGLTACEASMLPTTPPGGHMAFQRGSKHPILCTYMVYTMMAREDNGID